LSQKILKLFDRAGVISPHPSATADMCLAIPGKIESVDGRVAIVDFGGVKREAIVDLMEKGTIVPGTWVLVHTGFVIQTLDEKEALETLEAWREVLANTPMPEDES
jgi:hydrogenase expression/formation protein HypC